MALTIRAIDEAACDAARAIWNAVVRDGHAFPQEDELDAPAFRAFCASQRYTGVACDADGTVLGLYILHPNNVGRCAHIANASYAVAAQARGRGLGHALVRHSLETAADLGFRGLQFNAVLADNTAARRVYTDCGFEVLARVPGGFRDRSGAYKDTLILYRPLRPAADQSPSAAQA